ncbi:aminoacetone oxidase family FAD-binding enzyme [Aliidiomarina sedimenti]|uniref:Aminoacetone oxidase family FAD-binding enzyme n=1 Tax=Aliidiomarina sedimenti TaxID=1933879 RepID=A0ABY0BY26_9GAMM|nr:NAD(P)/FAD-dependent oxidoreductase [Aliidiomarina sedimenti]RUO29175.1 aminoacetone oxidase family FAD-binding enzyme [Aliidiomarina sedimenti]
METKTFDCIILGAGAAGLHCAATAAKRGKSVLVLDHAKQAGKKILISGGGRCNFTNMYTAPDNFLSANPHFCKSALSRYTQWDFIAQVSRYGIAYHEKTLGQLFCDDSAKQIVRMLLDECAEHGARVQLRTNVTDVSFDGQEYQLDTSQGTYNAKSVVVATGGLSMPKLGATAFGFKLAEQFGHSIQPVRAGLVPFTLHDSDKAQFEPLAGTACDVIAASDRASFKEAMLFTHRGVSGPAILQVSSYWQPGESVHINLMPDADAFEALKASKQQQPKMGLKAWLSQHIAKRLVSILLEREKWPQKNLADYSHAELSSIAECLHNWSLKPNGTEGYRTAEVTLGGVNVDEVSSKTMQSKLQPGLYFIGEVLDVTGWLGGYNFQWAWSSAWVCGESV